MISYILIYLSIGGLLWIALTDSKKMTRENAVGFLVVALLLWPLAVAITIWNMTIGKKT